MKQIDEKNEKVVNINWMQVLAFGYVIDNINEDNKVLKTTAIFEVMP